MTRREPGGHRRTLDAALPLDGPRYEVAANELLRQLEGAVSLGARRS